MLRKLLSLLSGLALIAVFAEGLVVATLWAQGRINNDVIHEFREILRNPAEATAEAATIKNDIAQKPSVTLEEVMRERSLRVLQISEREREYQRLQGLVTDSRAAVLKDLEAVTKEREQFAANEKLKMEKEQSEAVERARSILAKSDPATVADQLMKLPLEDNLILMKGMSEKRVAELLQTFSAGDPKSAQRGQELFQAISSGKSPPAVDANATSKN